MSLIKNNQILTEAAQVYLGKIKCQAINTILQSLNKVFQEGDKQKT